MRHWARNLERHAGSSLWLRTSTDRFHSDQVAQLKGGQVFFVASRCAHLLGAPDSRE